MVASTLAAMTVLGGCLGDVHSLGQELRFDSHGATSSELDDPNLNDAATGDDANIDNGDDRASDESPSGDQGDLGDGDDQADEGLNDSGNVGDVTTGIGSGGQDSTSGPGDGGDSGSADLTGSGSGSEIGAEESAEGGDAGVHPERARELAAGYSHACDLNDDDEVVCWGNGRGTYVPRSEVFPGEVVEIAAGWEWTCVLMYLSEGHSAGFQAIGCWGMEERLHELKNTDKDPYIKMDGAYGHLCLVRESGWVDCLPVGNQGFRIDPPSNGDYIEVSVGRDHACGLTRDREIRCWGDRNWEQLYSTPPPRGRFSTLASGTDFDCAVDEEHQLQCWTRYDRHNLLQAIPDSIPPLHVLDATHTQICAVDTKSKVHCWPGPFSNDPNAIPRDDFIDVVVASHFACGRLKQDEADLAPGPTSCWGFNTLEPDDELEDE